MTNTQRCHMDPRGYNDATREREFTVTALSDDGNQWVTFNCQNESSARALRDAIREHAIKVAEVFDAVAV